jgi:hypothetical protein
MSDAMPIHVPAGYVPEHAIAFAAEDGSAAVVGADRPLPVATSLGAAGATALAGTTAASATPGPFLPDLGRPIWVTLSGSWTGSVQLLRSTDGGATRLPLTYPDGTAKALWTANANTPVAEETVAAASYYLAVALTSGTLGYRVEQ